MRRWIAGDREESCTTKGKASLVTGRRQERGSGWRFSREVTTGQRQPRAGWMDHFILIVLSIIAFAMLRNGKWQVEKWVLRVEGIKEGVEELKGGEE